jgi:TonB family protein
MTRRIAGRCLALAAAAALLRAAPLAAQQDTASHAASAGHARRAHDAFRACPGQEAQMALMAGRAPVRRRPHVVPEIYRIRAVEVSAPLGSTAAPSAANPGTRIAVSDEVQLQLQVDADGKVREVSVVEASDSPELDQAIAEEAREQRFDPATESAFPVPGCAIQTIQIRG